jgi:hypothetical protein
MVPQPAAPTVAGSYPTRLDNGYHRLETSR